MAHYVHILSPAPVSVYHTNAFFYSQSLLTSVLHFRLAGDILLTYFTLLHSHPLTFRNGQSIGHYRLHISPLTHIITYIPRRSPFQPAFLQTPHDPSATHRFPALEEPAAGPVSSGPDGEPPRLLPSDGAPGYAPSGENSIGVRSIWRLSIRPSWVVRSATRAS